VEKGQGAIGGSGYGGSSSGGLNGTGRQERSGGRDCTDTDEVTTTQAFQ
jgi:hypothetical protein